MPFKTGLVLSSPCTFFDKALYTSSIDFCLTVVGGNRSGRGDRLRRGRSSGSFAEMPAKVVWPHGLLDLLSLNQRSDSCLLIYNHW